MPSLNDMPRIHHREHLVSTARAGVFDAIKDLTPGEQVRVLSAELASIAKYLLRHERHGNTETPGGLAAREEERNE